MPGLVCTEVLLETIEIISAARKTWQRLHFIQEASESARYQVDKIIKRQ